MLMVTAVCAGILGIMSVAIGTQIGLLRELLDVPLGDGGHLKLLLAVRRHGNFMEWVPMTLLLIWMLEMSGAPKPAIHGLGASLVAARLFQAIGLRGDRMGGVGRTVGAAGTALIVVVASVWLIVTFAATGLAGA